MLNQIIIMGRLTGNPELRHTSAGVAVAAFRIACDRDYQIDGGQKCDFVDCTAWRKTAEFVSKYFQKGKPILIQGRLQMREWTDRNGGKRVTAEILANEVHFCGGDKVNNAVAPAPAPAPVPAAPGVGAPPEFEELADDGKLPWELDEGELPL